MSDDAGVGPEALTRLRQAYEAEVAGRDEWVSCGDASDWTSVLGWLAGQDADTLDNLSTDMTDQLREYGAAFNPRFEQHRSLDLLPWVIGAADWQALEAGLMQRRRVLSAAMRDLYGDQRLLKDGVLPPDLLFRNAGYMLPCHGLLDEDSEWLVQLNCDVGRDAQGRWCAYGDSTLSPGGLGYALENRLALTQVVPELSGRFQKRRLAGFFKQLQKTLAPAGAYTAEPLIGLLTRNYRDQQYLEHAFLANYLDIALVHGSDLMYKDGRLWLKTLSGLQPMDGLMRYLPDALSDPLELDGDGIGSAGLLQAIRQGMLVCCNPPGVGVIDSGALLPFMAGLCEALLGETLLLPTVPAWWCGEPASLAVVMSRPDGMIIHDLATPGAPIAVGLLDNDARMEWLARLQTDPGRYVARQALALSTVPVWQDSTLQSRHAVLRSFVLSGEQGDAVLPGGLARCGEDALELQHGMDAPFVGKDVWLPSETEQRISLLQSAMNRVRLSRKAGLLPSRVADHLFWMGRYSERLNLACRALRAALPLVSTVAREDQVRVLSPMVEFACTINGGHFTPTTSEDEIIAQLVSLFDRDRPDGLLSLMQSLIMNAQSVREYFSEDTWYVLERLQNALNSFPSQGSTSRMVRALDNVILLQSAIYGLNNETMSRTQTLRFMDIGQHLERALKTTAMLEKVFVTHPVPPAMLMEVVLRMADTLMTYRRRYRSELHPIAIIDLLLLDEGTPRSVGYQCKRLRRQVHDLPDRDSNLPGLNAEQRVMVELVSILQLVDTDELMNEQGEPAAPLVELMRRVQMLLAQLSDAITLAYFNHTDIPRPIDRHEG